MLLGTSASVPVRGGCAAVTAARDWWSTGDRGGFVKIGRINIHPNNILGFWVLNLNTMGIFKLVFLKVVIERAYSRQTRRVFVNIIGVIKRNYIEEHQRENRVTINRHNRERRYRAELQRRPPERK